MFQLAWRDEPVDVNAWVVDYARHRYGRDNAHAAQAWQQLAATAYRAPAGDHAIFDRAPTLGGGRGGAAYNQTQLAEAWRELQRAADDLKDADTYRYDLVNVARQVLSNCASVLHQDVLDAWGAKGAPARESASQ